MLVVNLSTPAIFAVAELQKKLVKAGSNLVSAVAGVPSLEGVNLLSKAIEWEKSKVCKYLIKDIKIDINAPNEHGITPNNYFALLSLLNFSSALQDREVGPDCIQSCISINNLSKS